jgi:ATP-binding cassette subfamily C protein CydD
MVIFFGLGISGGALAVGQAYYLATIVDQVFLQGKDLSGVGGMLALLLAVFLGRGAVNFLINWLGTLVAILIKGQLRELVMAKFFSLAPELLVREKTGQLVGIITDGIDQTEVYFSRYLPQLMQAMTIPAIVLLVVFSNSLISGVIILVTAPLIPFFMVIIGSMADKKAQKQLSNLFRFSGHFLDVLQGITTLKIFGQSKRERDRIFSMSNQFRDSTMEVLKIAFLSALMLEILATISTAMIAVEVGLRLVYGKHSFQTAFFILLLAPEVYLPLKNLGSSFHAGRSSIAAAEKVWKVVELEGEKPCWGKQKFPGSIPPKLELYNISYRYGPGQNVLTGITFSIYPREKVAIVGKSGSGKTTLLKLILGIILPSSGQIAVNGVPIGQLTEQEWFNRVAYVSQEPYLFAGTIRDNITLGAKEANQEAVEKACQLAGVDRFVKELPKGYDTLVGEGGWGLSGGEKQRLAMARAFLKEAALVVLDEPTAKLDLQSQQVINQAMAELKKERTLVTVAHRLQTVIDADKIVLLDKGQVAAIGTHRELLEQSDLYGQIIAPYRGEL